MSKTACWDLNSKGDFLKLHDVCPNSKCKYQKQPTFKPKQSQLERT